MPCAHNLIASTSESPVGAANNNPLASPLRHKNTVARPPRQMLSRQVSNYTINSNPHPFGGKPENCLNFHQLCLLFFLLFSHSRNPRNRKQMRSLALADIEKCSIFGLFPDKCVWVCMCVRYLRRESYFWTKIKQNTCKSWTQRRNDFCFCVLYLENYIKFYWK